MDDVIFEVREQTVPVPGWVVVARFSGGREEQLLGVFVEEDFAQAWIRYEGQSWLRRREAELK